MNTWQHIKGMDYLRNRAERFLNKGQTAKSASRAAGGKRPVSKAQTHLGCNQTVGNVPAIGEMTGGTWSKG